MSLGACDGLHANEMDGQQADIDYRWLALWYRGAQPGERTKALQCGHDRAGLPVGRPVLGPVRGDEGMICTAKAVEDTFARLEQTARPLGTMQSRPHSHVDQTSIGTPSPETRADTACRRRVMRTAVQSVADRGHCCLPADRGHGLCLSDGGHVCFDVVAVNKSRFLSIPATTHLCPKGRFYLHGDATHPRLTAQSLSRAGVTRSLIDCATSIEGRFAAVRGM